MSQIRQPSTNLTFLRINQVKEITGLSRSYIYQLTKSGQFPKPVVLVPGGTAVGWIKSEIDTWLNERILAREEVIS